ncbi:MAG TPA: monovalent cation/H(+) antiporter subunit G [Desulfohalobiaceae bacterium]|nr:monovalent cation/H(+) antiporter subunit G [Desulfohalobiaceae bacterium]
MDILIIAIAIAGLVFFTGGSFGIFRMPDFYTRLHPAGKLDTLGIMLVVFALALYNLEHFSLSSLLVSLKMVLIVIFIFISSPTATHSIVDAGIRAGLVPWINKDHRRRK